MKLDYIKKLPDNYELIVISFFLTNRTAMVKLRAQWAKRDQEHKESKGRKTKPVSSKTFGGSVCLIDPKRLKNGFLKEIKCPVATGIFYSENEKCLYVGSNKCIRKIKNGRVISKFGNSLFNDIHGLAVSSKNNLLVTSTGVDGIIEIDLKTKLKTWDWLATENGYNKNPKGGTRFIDRNLDYQKISTTTPEHATHINSCLEYKPNKILATLFHQGCLIEIDKNTKKSRILLCGLKCPHSIRKRKDGGFIISDTLNNRVVLLDKKFRLRRAFTGGYNWVQDTIELHDGNLLIEDSNNSKLVKIDKNGKKIGGLTIKKDTKKMFGLLSITKKQALSIFNINA